MKQTFLCLVCLIILIVSQNTSAQFPGLGTSEILPVDAAFRFGYLEEDAGITLFWQVQPGYFLYRDKIAVLMDGTEIDLQLAEGRWYLDETFGRVRVLDGYVSTGIPRARRKVSVHYQGCAERGYCYPPQLEEITSAK